MGVLYYPDPGWPFRTRCLPTTPRFAISDKRVDDTTQVLKRLATGASQALSGPTREVKTSCRAVPSRALWGYSFIGLDEHMDDGPEGVARLSLCGGDWPRNDEAS